MAASIASTRSGEATPPACRSVRANPSTVPTTSRRTPAESLECGFRARATPFGASGTEECPPGQRVHPFGVLPVLEHRAEGARGEVRIEVAGAEGVQRGRPVHRLGDP